MTRPIIALLYDFDKTLCTTDMENYTFIPALGYTPAQFWQKANSFGRDNHMDGLLAYMYTMIHECREQDRRLDRDFLVRCGRDMVLFPGVREWFRRINAFGQQLGVEIEHYVISSGLREIIEGSGIAHEFREIYACEFFYDEEKGCYIDGYASGKRNVPRHGNIFAILFDIADAQRQASLVQNVLDNPDVPPEKRPSVISAQALSRCLDLRYDVG